MQYRVDLTISVYHVVGQRFLQYRRQRPSFFTPELQFGRHFKTRKPAFQHRVTEVEVTELYGELH